MGRIARIVLACVCAAAACAAPAPNRWLFVGTYTGVKSKGIYAFRFNDRTGALTPVGLVAETTNPSFLTLSADGRRLFAVNETARFGEEASGSVSAFSVDQTTGALALINVQSSRGADPCHLMIDPGGRF